MSKHTEKSVPFQLRKGNLSQHNGLRHGRL